MDCIIPNNKRTELASKELTEHLHSIERSRVGHNSLLGGHDLSVLQSDTSSSAIFDNNLVNMSIQLDLSTELLQSADKSVTQFAGSSERNRVASALLKETLQNVKHMRRHGSLGRETAEDAHGIDKVTQERNSHNSIDSLVEGVECKG
jgi:hypothetical protein